jgi:phage host-nuclease inhibitor protein Gam
MPVKTASRRVPQSIDEVDRDVQEIGSLDRQIGTIDSELAEKVSQLQSEAAERRQPLTEKREELSQGVHSYAEAHKAELTKSSKTVKLPSGGVLQWRMKPPRLKISGKLESIIRALKSGGHDEFIRVKESLKRDDLKRHPDVVKKIRGLSIGQDEEFLIKPAA